MPATVKSLGIDQLPLEERLALVHEIWDTIATEENLSLLSESQRLELKHRLAQDNHAPDEVIPWEEVKSRTIARLNSSLDSN